jgi:hypothetical protein
LAPKHFDLSQVGTLQSSIAEIDPDQIEAMKSVEWQEAAAEHAHRRLDVRRPRLQRRDLDGHSLSDSLCPNWSMARVNRWVI